MNKVTQNLLQIVPGIALPENMGFRSEYVARLDTLRRQ